MKDTLKNIAVLVFILVMYQLVSAAIGYVTMGEVQGWYQNLEKSVLTPPGWVFGVVWTSLYALLGVATWLIWMKREEYVVAPALMLFGLHMVLNWAWSFVFFTFHMLAVSFFWILAILGLAATLFFIFREIRPVAAYLMIPYMGWLCFAAYLSFFIWQNNALDFAPEGAMVPPSEIPQW